MFHANGWTFVWTVTAVGATHVCLPKIEPSVQLMARERSNYAVRRANCINLVSECASGSP